MQTCIVSFSTHLHVRGSPFDELSRFYRFLARSAARSTGGGGHHVPIHVTRVSEGRHRLVGALTNVAVDGPTRGEVFPVQLKPGVIRTACGSPAQTGLARCRVTGHVLNGLVVLLKRKELKTR